MNGRVYDAFLGRMVSADPTVPGAFNSQAFNRYSYVLNNAMRFTDPSGFTPVCGGSPICAPAWDGRGGTEIIRSLPGGSSCNDFGCTGQLATPYVDDELDNPGGVSLATPANWQPGRVDVYGSRISDGSTSGGAAASSAFWQSATDSLLSQIAGLAGLLGRMGSLDFNFSWGIAVDVSLVAFGIEHGNFTILSGANVSSSGLDFGGFILTYGEGEGIVVPGGAAPDIAFTIGVWGSDLSFADMHSLAGAPLTASATGEALTMGTALPLSMGGGAGVFSVTTSQGSIHGATIGPQIQAIGSPVTLNTFSIRGFVSSMGCLYGRSC